MKHDFNRIFCMLCVARLLVQNMPQFSPDEITVTESRSKSRFAKMKTFNFQEKTPEDAQHLCKTSIFKTRCYKNRYLPLVALWKCMNCKRTRSIMQYTNRKERKLFPFSFVKFHVLVRACALCL